MPSLSLYISLYTSIFKSLFTLAFARLYTPQTLPSRDLSGQIAIVTGANSGIGLSIATALVKQGATVYLACRNLSRGEAATDEVVSKAGEKSKNRVFCWELDVGDLNSVREFCDRWRRDGRKIDMLVHNAGIASPPSVAATSTKNGLELVYVTNFLGSFLMTRLLEGHLNERARVVFTSSTGHYGGGSVLRLGEATQLGTFGKLRRLLSQSNKFAQAKLGLTTSAPAYAQSKAQQVLFAHLLQPYFSSFPDNRRTAHAFTPGFTSTPIFGKFDVNWKTWISNPLFATLKATEKWVAVDADEGAKTGAWLASYGSEVEGGRYWERMTIRTSLIDMIRGTMDEVAFGRACRQKWAQWSKDAGVDWDVES